MIEIQRNQDCRPFVQHQILSDTPNLVAGINRSLDSDDLHIRIEFKSGLAVTYVWIELKLFICVFRHVSNKSCLSFQLQVSATRQHYTMTSSLLIYPTFAVHTSHKKGIKINFVTAFRFGDKYWSIHKQIRIVMNARCQFISVKKGTRSAFVLFYLRLVSTLEIVKNGSPLGENYFTKQEVT